MNIPLKEVLIFNLSLIANTNIIFDYTVFRKLINNDDHSVICLLQKTCTVLFESENDFRCHQSSQITVYGIVREGDFKCRSFWQDLSQQITEIILITNFVPIDCNNQRTNTKATDYLNLCWNIFLKHLIYLP